MRLFDQVYKNYHHVGLIPDHFTNEVAVSKWFMRELGNKKSR